MLFWLAEAYMFKGEYKLALYYMLHKLTQDMYEEMAKAEKARVYRKLACYFYLLDDKDNFQKMLDCAFREDALNGWYYMIKGITTFIDTQDLKKAVKEIHISLRIYTMGDQPDIDGFKDCYQFIYSTFEEKMKSLFT